MRAELLQMAAELTRREEPFVLAVVVRRRPASSAVAGDMALITASGGFHGWLGGSCTRPTVVREAQIALADGQTRLVVLTPDPETEKRPGVEVFPMTCHSGGSVEIYLEPVLPAPRLVVFGASPAARALVKLGKAMGYAVIAVDPDVAPDDFPEADEVLTRIDGAAAPPRGPRYVVVATLGERDEAAVREALTLQPVYLGLVASAKRFSQIRETLAASGVPAAALDAIRSPAGVKIKAETPEEIALSIIAEIVEKRRGEKAHRTDPTDPTDPTDSTTAVDPICGMTVVVAKAKHTAEHAGKTYYFCCGGCRERFLTAPEQYLAQGATA